MNKSATATLFTSLFALSLGGLIFITGLTTSHAKELSNPQNWQSDLLTNKDLVGKIWSRKKNAFISPKQLGTELKEKNYILLGETHDNPDHHWLQAQIIELLSQQNIKPSLVMEMIRVDQMWRLDKYRAQKNAKAMHLGTALLWEANGWPAWEMYLPIGELIFKHNLEVYPGMASRMTNNHLIKSNLFTMSQENKEKLKLNIALDPVLQKSLVDEVRSSHCDRLPERVLKPMAGVQRFRDAWMADVMIQAATSDDGKKRQVILVAGSGHTRDDRGVPWYLRKRSPETDPNSASIQFSEVTKTSKTIKDLAAKDPNGKLAADYIWLTPAVTRGNYCDSIPDFGVKKKEKAKP